MPTICGSVRRKPKLAPDDSSIVLFGPGVIDITSANVSAAGSTAGIGGIGGIGMVATRGYQRVGEVSVDRLASTVPIQFIK